MSDEWLITVAAGLLVLHGGTFLLALALLGFLLSLRMMRLF